MFSSGGVLLWRRGVLTKKVGLIAVDKVKVLRVLEMMEHDSGACIYGALVSIDTNDIFSNNEFAILDVGRKIILKDNDKVKVLRVLEMMEHDSGACIYGALVSIDTNDIFSNNEFAILDVGRKIILKDNEFDDEARTYMTIYGEETIKLNGFE
nr:hypothetical protein [Tanacetum cinerariifolium]